MCDPVFKITVRISCTPTCPLERKTRRKDFQKNGQILYLKYRTPPEREGGGKEQGNFFPQNGNNTIEIHAIRLATAAICGFPMSIEFPTLWLSGGHVRQPWGKIRNLPCLGHVDLVYQLHRQEILDTPHANTIFHQTLSLISRRKFEALPKNTILVARDGVSPDRPLPTRRLSCTVLILSVIKLCAYLPFLGHRTGQNETVKGETKTNGRPK